MTDLLPVRPPHRSLRDWFTYADREERNPLNNGMILTSSFSYAAACAGDLEWEREEWDIRAALVPLDESLNAAGAPAQAANSIRAHDLGFSPWWRNAGDFDFGDARYLDHVLLWPWIRHRVHRRTDRVIIEARSDFLQYHALDSRPLPDHQEGIEYVHPLEESVALRTWVAGVAHHNPTPFVEVQRDYLRDYLAARNAALLITVVADRFAHARTVADLELEHLEQAPVGACTWITTTVHEHSAYNAAYAMGRSSLYWNLLIYGYKEAKRARSPWHIHDERRESPNRRQGAPTFIMDSEGTRCTANDERCPAYLYFSVRVLDRYLNTTGYYARFHMRTWGTAISPHGGVDAGVNSRELLTAFGPDIAKLPIPEQMHWASHSVLPDGEVCVAMFETRMQQNPPTLPGLVGITADAFNRLVDAVHSSFGVQIADRSDGAPSEGGRLSIGPIHAKLSEVAELSVALYAWVVERIGIAPLRSILSANSVVAETSARQLGLLKLVLTKVAGTREAEAKQLLGPLDALNELRAKAAHIGTPDYAALLPRLGITAMPATPRRYWEEVVDAVASSLIRSAEQIERMPSRSTKPIR